jgi:TonB family protein
LALASDPDSSTLDALKFSLASDIVELVVLTSDEAFLQTLREAVGGARRLWHVLTPDKVPDLLVAGEVGILVLDTTVFVDSAAVFINQIKRQFPDLVVVVAGNRDAEVTLAQLISAGMIYRFIHKPMSPNRARLFVEAAVKKHDEQRRRAAQTPLREAPKRGSGFLILVLAGCAVAGFATYFGLRGTPHLPLSSEAPRAAHDSPLLAKADAALADNRLIAPPGDNALELYQQLALAHPHDSKAEAGLAEVRNRLLAKAENSLLEEHFDEAAADIEVARRSGVESGRIAFLTAQLAKSREQLKAAQAALHGRDRNPAPPVSSTTSPASPVSAEDKVTPLVNLAALRLEEGHLIEPERDNARFYVQEARKADPANPAAVEAERLLALRLLTEARGAIDRREFDRAAEWLKSAEGIASPANLDTSQALLSAARRQAQSDAQAQLLKNAGARLAEDRLIEPDNDNARYYLLTLKGLDPNYPGLASLSNDLGAKFIAKARLALTLKQYSAAKSWLDSAAGIGFASPEGNIVAHDLEVAQAAPATPALIPAAQLSLAKSVAPTYPAKAALKSIEGWVELDFTVTETGSVTDLSVHAASPPGAFEEAALRAVSQWRYQPVLRDSKPVSVRSRVRIRFTAPNG